MNRSSSILIGWHGVLLILAIVVAALPAPAWCQTDGTALLLQQTPAQGGRITPAAGVYRFDLGTDVTLTAVPNPGYQFIYWMGDVSNPTSRSTVTYLDAPKIIIAVFERVEYDFLVAEQNISVGGAGGRPIAMAVDLTVGGATAPGAKRPRKWRPPVFEPPEREEPPLQDFPVPEQDQGADFPVPEPIPEPATAVLLLLGSLAAFVRRRKN